MIESPRNSRVKRIRSLAQKAGRADTGLFLLEGPQAVREALRCRPELVDELFITPTARERHPELGELAFAAGLEVQFASEEVIEAMADTRTPQGVIASCRQFPVSLRRILEGEGERSPRLVVILEEVRDPGNAGTIIRAADAAGADAVVLTGRAVDPYHPKVVRATTGSIFHVPVAVGGELALVTQRAREAGLRVLAADIAGEELPLAQERGELAAPVAWVFGNEARGLSGEQLALSDGAVRVPVYGQAESLNLAIAAGVLLYASAFAQRRSDSP